MKREKGTGIVSWASTYIVYSFMSKDRHARRGQDTEVQVLPALRDDGGAGEAP